MGGVEESSHHNAADAQDAPSAAAGADQDPRRLVHELRVHQIELELQNEELEATRAKAEEAYRLYRDLYDYAPVAYLSIDGEGGITRANDASLALLRRDRDRLVGSPVHSLLAPEARAESEAFVARLFGSESTLSLEASLPLDDGTRAFVHIVGISTRAAKGECHL